MKNISFSLGERLKTVSEMVAPNSTIIDVGSDHAKLPVKMLLEDKIKKAYATDISQYSVEKIETIAKKYELSDKIVARQCDGLDGFDGTEFDTVIICGMGGETISHILSNAKWINDCKHDIIIQSMSSFDCLNKFLQNSNLKVVDEKIICDAGRIYSVVKLHGEEQHKNNSITLPSDFILSSNLCEKYLDRYIRITSSELNGILSVENKDCDKAKELSEYLSHYKTLKSKLHKEVV